MKALQAQRFRAALAVAALVAAVLLGAHAALAAQVKTAGKLSIPARASLFAVSTDPVIQYVLGQDFSMARRSPGKGSGTPVTVTVTVTQRLLKPGLTLGDLGPDAATVAGLLQAMGIAPPPLGDTGGQRDNPYAAMAKHQVLQPTDPMQGFRQYQAANQAMTNAMGPRFGPNGRATDREIYDTLVIARATASGSSQGMTAVAVVHPGDNLRAAKELVAEEIANAILH